MQNCRMPEIEGKRLPSAASSPRSSCAAREACEPERGRGARGWTRRQAHSSERASFHDENWAGDAVTVQRDKSRTEGAREGSGEPLRCEHGVAR